jgi:polysaccharide biosynthesis transport protein
MMLQIDYLRGAGQRGAWQGLSAAEFYTAAVGFFRRQFYTVTFALLLSLTLGAIYIFTTPPLYTGHAILIVDTPRMQLFQSQSPLVGPSIDSATVDTQIAILKSDDIALSVIKDLHLYEDPEFISPSAGALSAIRGAINGVLNTIFSLGGRHTVSEPSAEYRALQTFQKGLKVTRVGNTYAIEITFESRNPVQAAQIANAIADAYAVDAFEAKFQITDQAAKWLQGRLKELREQTSDSERAVVEYKSKNNIVDTGGRLMNEQQLAELNSELIQARAATAEAKARVDRVDQIVASGDVDPNATATATVTDTLHNEVINKLRGQYLDDERRASEWAAKYGANHQAVLGLRRQMLGLRQNIFEELKRTAETYKSDYAIAQARAESIQQSLDHLISESHGTEEARVTLHNLESTAQTYRDLYDNFLQRYMQSLQQQSSPVSESRLITHARPPLTKSWPRSTLIMALAWLGGLIFGAAIGVLREISDRVFRTTMQIGEHLQADCIAVIPRVKEVAGPDASFQKAQLAGPPRGVHQTRLISRVFDLLPISLTAVTQVPTWRRRRRRSRSLSRDSSVCWTVANSPFSRFSESIRAVKVAADNNVIKASKTIGVTSSVPNEGKSTVAVSLAALITQGGGRALLVDCDLRNPALSGMLTPDARAGLLEIIAGKAGLEEVLWREPITGLAFLPTVLKSRVANSSDILTSQETRKLFEQLRETYDYVIVDLSPLAPVVDVRVTTPLVDSFLFVVEWGHTKINVAQLALRSARGVCDNLLGIVLNKADMKALGRYAIDHENYYINRHYGRYGYTD